MSQNIYIKRRMSWLLSLGMSSGLLVIAVFWLKIRYPINDDVVIMREIMGYGYGEPVTFQLFTHAFLLWPLRLLHTLWPSIPWYSYMQLAFAFISLTVIAKSIMQCFLIYNKSLWIGSIFSAAFLIAFGFEYTAKLSFTQTSALLGAASVAQLLSTDNTHLPPARALLGTIGSVVLMVFSYCMRADVLMPALPYGALAFVYLFWKQKQENSSLKPLVFSLIIAICVLSITFGVRLWELSSESIQAYTAWNIERRDLMDYHYKYLFSLPSEAFDLVGWDSETLNMITEWFFLDPAIDTQAFHNLNEYIVDVNLQTLEERLHIIKELFKKRLHDNPREIRLFIIFVVAGLVSSFASLFRKGHRMQLLFVLGCIAVGGSFMLFYLAYRGRLPIRAVITVVLPAIAMMLCVLPACFDHRHLGKLLVCLLAVVVFVCVFCLSYPFLSQLLTEADSTTNAYVDLEAYALDHPQDLFIANIYLSWKDYRAFPNYSDGIPLNIAYWGGWDFRSPGSATLFKRFDIDVWDFDPEAFLYNNVFFATDKSVPPSSLLNWLTQKTAKDITWDVIAHEGGIYILHFRENGGST